MLMLISDTFDPSLPDKLSQFGKTTDDKSRLGEEVVAIINECKQGRKL